MAEGSYGCVILTLNADASGEVRPDEGKQWSIVSIESDGKIELRRYNGTLETVVNSSDTEPTDMVYPGKPVTRDAWLKIKNKSASQKSVWVFYVDTTPAA